MNYINPKILKENGYNRATIESSHGSYSDCGYHAKTFFYSNFFKGDLDHGNHYHTNDYFLSNFCLVHYHARNLEQMKKKVYNNVFGLGHNPFDISKLIETAKTNCDGFHHINNQISILQNTYKIPITVLEPTDIILEPISKKLLSLNL
jgi:phosphoglycerol transferase MdoB-like AlkP superfamily enzyme